MDARHECSKSYALKNKNLSVLNVVVEEFYGLKA